MTNTRNAQRVARRASKKTRHLFALRVTHCALLVFLARGAQAATTVELKGHVPKQVRTATRLERVSADESVPLSLVVQLDQILLDQAFDQLYGKNAPAQKHFLSPAEFSQKFGLAEKRKKLKEFAKAHGLTVDPAEDRSESMAVKVSGRAESVEKAFTVKLHQYRGADGKRFRAHDTEPVIPEDMTPHLSAVLGLSNVAGMRKPQGHTAANLSHPVPGYLAGATGPIGALSPSDIKTIYGMNQVNLDGAGQTVALIELGGYYPSDIAAYASYYGLPAGNITNVFVDGATNTVTDLNWSATSSTFSG